MFQYKKTVQGCFIDRPNRFVAHVEINGQIETVHVKNTGRCRELLLPQAKVILAQADNPERKTKYDLVTVWKDGLGWVNIDSQIPNVIAGQWLRGQKFDLVKAEYTYGDSRIDYYMERGNEKYLMEVKGCTLEIDGVGYFPDAPTQRGVKHLQELTKAAAEGYHTAIAFVIQMNGINRVLPNLKTHPQFGQALDEAVQAGVKVVYIPCQVTEDGISAIENASVQ